MVNKSSIVLFLFGLVFQTNASSQNNSDGALLSSIPAHKVMIIPFNQFNYFSDADAELASKNKKESAEISTLFRYGLNYNVSARVITSVAYNILTDTTLQSQKDLSVLYSSIKYSYQKPIDAFTKDSAENKNIIQKDLFGAGGQPIEKEDKKLFKEAEPVEELEHAKYLNAVLSHPEILKDLSYKYETDLFLFINQFELITNYNHCLDRTANYFERKVIVHYSIYNADGKQLKGDAVTVTFSSAQTSVDDIIGKNFPIIGEYLNQSLNSSENPPTQKTK